MASNNKSNERILAIALVTRHGMRGTPDKSADADSANTEIPLTEAGYEQMCRLGCNIRAKYARSFAVDEAKVEGKSSPVGRCMHSAAEVLRGFSAAGATTDIVADQGLRAAWVDPSPGFAYVNDMFRDVVSYAVPDATGMSFGKLVMAVIIACDNVQTDFETGKDISHLDEILVHRMNQYLEYFFQDYMRDRNFLLKEVAHIVDYAVKRTTAAADSKTPLFLVMATHDSVISRILKVIGLLGTMAADQPFAANITFELSEDKKTEERFFRIYYNKDVNSYPGRLLAKLSPQQLLKRLAP